MEDHSRLSLLSEKMGQHLTDTLLPYWIDRTPDNARGGFFGRIAGDDHIHPEADRGSILYSRILWIFSAAYREIGDPAYAEMARRACDYLAEYFWDREEGGVYWMVDSNGSPRDTRKHVYAQAFALYGLAEYSRATGSTEALGTARTAFDLIERHGRDQDHGGYFEAFDRFWQPLADVRLSDRDRNEPKSLNTHLHVMEAYATLFRAWPDEALRSRLTDLVELFLSRMLVTGGGTYAFYDVDWTPMSRLVSYGHDIEASWLLLEATDILDDGELRTRVRDASLGIAEFVLDEGVDSDGGILNEVREDGSVDTDKHWWPQAEAVVGFVNAFQETEEDRYLRAADRAWDFIEKHIIDRKNGEWFFRVSRDGRPYPEEDKVGPWKCPYHNGRACLELLRRAEEYKVRLSTKSETGE